MANSFQIGDRVKQLVTCGENIAGNVYELYSWGATPLYARIRDGIGCSCIGLWEFVEENKINKKTIMKKLTPMLKRLLDKDTQTLYKAEYINGNLELTERGKSALMTILFEANKAGLVALAEEEIAEAKEDKEN